MKENDRVVFYVIISGLAMNRHVRATFRVFGQIEKYGIQPDGNTFGGLLCGCTHAGLFVEAHNLNKSMPMKPNTIVLGGIIGRMRLHCDTKLAEPMLKQVIDGMKQKKLGDTSHPMSPKIFEKHERLFKELREVGYSPTTEFVFFDIEEKEKEYFLGCHSEKFAVAFSLIKTGANDIICVVKNLCVCGYHYDVNFITIHSGSRFHGLNIWLRNGQKVKVKLSLRCLLIQTGKRILLTGFVDRWISPPLGVIMLNVYGCLFGDDITPVEIATKSGLSYPESMASVVLCTRWIFGRLFPCASVTGQMGPYAQWLIFAIHGLLRRTWQAEIELKHCLLHGLNSFNHLKTAHCRLLRLNIDHDNYLLNIILQYSFFFCNTPYAKRIISQSKNPKIYLFNTMICETVSSDSFEDAVLFYNSMGSAGFLPDN
ncbi:hypothetical protein HN873_061000 [Arachis hypogaea]